MRYLSFKILLLCIIFPPVCYILTAYIAEQYSQNYFAGRIENIYTGDLQPLLRGNVRLKSAIDRNIHNFLKNQPITHMGLKVEITVVTKQGTILYPDITGGEEISYPPPDPLQVAAEQLRPAERRPDGSGGNPVRAQSPDL